MIKNFLVIGWRNLLKHKLYSLINIIGLSLSMSVCLLIILLIYNQYQYDRFHPAGDRTYRILSHQKGTRNNLFESGYATSPLPFRDALDGKFPAIERMTNLNHQFRGELQSEQRIIRVDRSLFADENFFKVFGFTLAEGDPETALRDPNSLVLMPDLVAKLFPDGNAMDQLVTLDQDHAFTVKGILNPPPGDSHIQFEALASFSSLDQLKADDFIDVHYDEWNNIWTNYNYLVLQDPGEKDNLEKSINDIAEENIHLEEKEPGYEFSLQRVTDIVPGRLLSNEIGFALPKFVLAFFALLALIVMFTASINYANLTIARTLNRFKEIGIRKSSGAAKGQIIRQFLTESILMAVLSLLFAVVFYRILLSQFNAMWIFSQIGITLHDEPVAYIFFLVFSLLLGLISGVGPALYASRMDPVTTLKGAVLNGLTVRKRRVNIKNLMIGVQLGLSVLMLITLFLLRDEAHFLTNADYGFDEQQIYFVDLQSHAPDRVETAFKQIPGIEEISMASHHPGVGRSWASGYRLHPEDEEQTIYYFSVDTGYLDVMGLDLVAGNNFSSQAGSGDEKQVILNEMAAERLGFNPVSDAVGQYLYNKDDQQIQVVGVIKNYHWEPMLKAMTPMMLRVIPDNYNFAYFKINSPAPGAVVQAIQKEWKEFDPLRDFNGGFLSQEMDVFYQFLFDISKILMLIAMMAISITGLGLLGMISMRVRGHMKELGIRKVLGASFVDLFMAVGKEFLWLIGISLLVAVPVSIWINSLWINNMAQREPISAFNIGPAVLLLIGLTLLLILWQVWRALRDNPIEALRSDQ